LPSDPQKASSLLRTMSTAPMIIIRKEIQRR
jgi:hypothetical protein